MNVKKFKKEVDKLWISNKHDLERSVLGLAGEVGEVCDLRKKFLRQDFQSTDDVQKYYDKMKLEVGDVFFYLFKYCDEMEYDVEEVFDACIKKLKSRKKRNKLKGSGDDR